MAANPCSRPWILFVIMACYWLEGSSPGPLLGGESAPIPEATPPSALSLENGFYSRSPWLYPGKVDFLYRETSYAHNFNLIGWTPVFKGGAGLVHGKEEGAAHRYGGGYLRPLAAWPDKGDLILGALAAQQERQTDYEVQGEYRVPFGLGLGGGGVDRAVPGADLWFAKLTYRRSWGPWHSILEIQAQETEDHLSPGGYVALYDDQWMGVAGTDGEQWRAVLGFIAPASKHWLRPAAEVLFVDNSIGRIDGPQVLFANATLGFGGGFLSHPARLGRAMGPQGLEYGNPLGFLRPTWNRRLDLWELGRLANLRLEYIRFPDDTSLQQYEALVFPFQWFPTPSVLHYLFVGGSYADTSERQTAGLLAGLTGAVGGLQVSAALTHQLDPHETLVVVGLIDFF